MTSQSPKLILLPGLGADSRLFDPQRQAFRDLWSPPWILPRNYERLIDYAERMAEVVALREPFVLGGVSLGGMIAYEIARHVKAHAVILIASCRTRQGIRGFFQTAGHIWPAVPAGAFKVAKFLSLPALRMFGKTDARPAAALLENVFGDGFRVHALGGVGDLALESHAAQANTHIPNTRREGSNHSRKIRFGGSTDPRRRAHDKSHPRRRGECVYKKYYFQNANRSDVITYRFPFLPWKKAY